MLKTTNDNVVDAKSRIKRLGIDCVHVFCIFLRIPIRRETERKKK